MTDMELSNQKKTTLWIVGDSTVSSFHDNYYMPRYGWGTALGFYFNNNIKIENLALSGTSSKSFRKHENYTKFRNGIASGDFLVIGFGHNDEKNGEVTFTSGSGDLGTDGSFANSLYRYYIAIAQEAGADVILTTPIVRRDPEKKYTGDKVHVTANGDYAQAVRNLGEDLSLPVCDLTEQTRALALKVDADEDPDNDTLFQHAWTGSKPLCVDDTHTSLFGAVVNAYLFAEELKKSSSSLKTYLREAYQNPLTNAAFWKKQSVNPLYEEPVYVQPEKTSAVWPEYKDANGNIWYGTVFGDINGGTAGSKEEFYLGKAEDGNLEIRAGITRNNGKIMNKSDGLAMYFTRIPAKESLRLSADVTLEGFNTAGAAADFSAFGLMARDDMYIDAENGLIMGDYVAAGITFRPGFEKGSNTFARKSGLVDFEGGELEKVPQDGDVMRMCVASTRDGYMAQIGEADPVIAGYDFALTAVDPDYVYVGFFAARTVSVKISSIELTIGDEVQKDYDGFARK